MAGSDDGESALFAGVDDTETPPPSEEVLENDQAPLAGGMTVGLEPFLNDLTYREMHAFTFGFIPLFLAIVLVSPVLSGAAVGVVLAAIYGRSGRRFASIPKHVVREPHYVLGGALLAWVSASMLMGAASVAGSLWGVAA